MSQDGEPQDGAGRLSWDRRSINLVGVGLAAFAAAAVLAALVLTGILGGGDDEPGEVTSIGSVYAGAWTPAPTNTPAPTPTPPSDAPVERILIPKYDVDAAIVIKGIVNGAMESPDGPWDVAWYDFSAHPGFGSNAVFSGHVDYHTVGAAVFWNVKSLVEGDRIFVRLADGTQYEYSVSGTEQVTADADVSTIVGATDREIVTLITCGGTFNPATSQYDQRLIVQAERVYPGEPESPAPGTSGAQ